MQLYDFLEQKATEEGIPMFGMVDIEPSLTSDEFKHQYSEYLNWLNEGLNGEMAYLSRGKEFRLDPRNLFPPARSVFSIGVPYPAQMRNQTGPKYARYLAGTDYHKSIHARLFEVMTQAKKIFPDLEWKICVDTSAVLERLWAYLAGLGWIGKNSLLIHPRYGSYFFLAEVFTNYQTGRTPNPIKNLCGNCQKCLFGCPTKAFPRDRVLDSNKCISYLTLEKRGDYSEIQQGKAGKWIAGCDICQEVCPFNQKRTADDPFFVTPELEVHLPTSWDILLSETERDYKLRVKRSSIARIKYKDFQRNLAYSLLESLRQDGCPIHETILDRVRSKMNSTINSPETEKIYSVWRECESLFLQIKKSQTEK